MCSILTAEPGGGGRAEALLIKEQAGALISASEGAASDRGAWNLGAPADGCVEVEHVPLSRHGTEGFF